MQLQAHCSVSVCLGCLTVAQSVYSKPAFFKVACDQYVQRIGGIIMGSTTNIATYIGCIVTTLHAAKSRQLLCHSSRDSEN